VQSFQQRLLGVDEMQLHARVTVVGNDCAAYRGEHRDNVNQSCKPSVQAAPTLSLLIPAICILHLPWYTLEPGRCHERELNDVRTRGGFQELLQQAPTCAVASGRVNACERGCRHRQVMRSERHMGGSRVEGHEALTKVRRHFVFASWAEARVCTTGRYHVCSTVAIHSAAAASSVALPGA
jgi:hypothetical protein